MTISFSKRVKQTGDSERNPNFQQAMRSQTDDGREGSESIAMLGTTSPKIPVVSSSTILNKQNGSLQQPSNKLSNVNA